VPLYNQYAKSKKLPLTVSLPGPGVETPNKAVYDHSNQRRSDQENGELFIRFMS
jgi:hypothetical protein